jgi:hypothetical protein
MIIRLLCEVFNIDVRCCDIFYNCELRNDKRVFLGCVNDRRC